MQSCWLRLSSKSNGPRPKPSGRTLSAGQQISPASSALALHRASCLRPDPRGPCRPQIRSNSRLQNPRTARRAPTPTMYAGKPRLARMGLDPAIQAALRRCMDARVKPAHDASEDVSPGNCRAVLLVRHLLEPLNVRAVEMLLERDVNHPGPGRRAVPMLLVGRDPYGIASLDLADRAAPSLNAADPRYDMQRLAERVRVPRGPRARLEAYPRRPDAGRGRGLDDGVL